MPRLCVGGPGQQASDGGGANTECMGLSGAVVTYRWLGSGGKGITHQAAERACGYLTDTCGKPLTDYTAPDAHAFRDALSARGMTGSNIPSVFVKWGRLTNPFGKVDSD